jgi:hypothetical protein
MCDASDERVTIRTTAQSSVASAAEGHNFGR